MLVKICFFQVFHMFLQDFEAKMMKNEPIFGLFPNILEIIFASRFWKKQILTMIWSMHHPNAGQNIQVKVNKFISIGTPCEHSDYTKTFTI